MKFNTDTEKLKVKSKVFLNLVELKTVTSKFPTKLIVQKANRKLVLVDINLILFMIKYKGFLFNVSAKQIQLFYLFITRLEYYLKTALSIYFSFTK